MTDNRKPLLRGDTLYLDKIPYLLTGDAVMQGDVIAYKATSPDSGPWDDILVREFYPRHLHQGLCRTENGDLQCGDMTRQQFEARRSQFSRGEQLESGYLASLPPEMGAKSVCYDEHGTSYSVRRLHKSIVLETLMQKDPAYFSLEKVLPLVHNLLAIIEGIHREGFLHLAVHPSQIHLLAENVLFLDHTAFWENGNQNFSDAMPQDYLYIAPEIRLQDWQNIGPASDFYAVAALMYRMLYGRDCAPECLKTELAMQKSPSACFLLSVLRKGLHILPRKRFSSADEFRSALRVLEALAKREQAHFEVCGRKEDRGPEKNKKTRLLLQ